jgi:hypothetical protein
MEAAGDGGTTLTGADGLYNGRSVSRQNQPGIKNSVEIWRVCASAVDDLPLHWAIPSFLLKGIVWRDCAAFSNAGLFAIRNGALLHRTPPANLMFHSDRGVQYASGDFRQALSQAGLVPSMSRKGNCYDNAFMESFWSTLKLELVYRGVFEKRAQARTQIFDYIEVFYNRQRAHSALDYNSPVDFETLNN